MLWLFFIMSSSWVDRGRHKKTRPGLNIQTGPGSFCHQDPVGGFLSAGLLALGSSEPPRPSPQGGPWKWPDSRPRRQLIPDYSGGTATDLHRVPGCWKAPTV